MKEKIQLLAAALALILLLCGCAARGTASNDAKPAAGDVTDSNAAPYEVPAFRDSVFNEEEATAFGSGEIDLSQLEGGVIGVKAQSDTRLKMQIVCGEDKYNYDLPNDGTATFFPLNMGNGTYTFRLMEQVGDSKYACIGSEDRDVTLKDEFQPYLRPNQMVNYNKSSDCIRKVKELAACSLPLISKFTREKDEMLELEYKVSLIYCLEHINATNIINDEFKSFPIRKE